MGLVEHIHVDIGHRRRTFFSHKLSNGFHQTVGFDGIHADPEDRNPVYSLKPAPMIIDAATTRLSLLL